MPPKRLGWEVLLTPDEETGSHGTAAPLPQCFASTTSSASSSSPAAPTATSSTPAKARAASLPPVTAAPRTPPRSPNDGRSAILALAEFLLEAAEVPPGDARRDGQRRQHPRRHRRDQRRPALRRIRDRHPHHSKPPTARSLARALPNAIADRTDACGDGLELTLKGGFNRPPKECLPAEEAAFPEWLRAAADVGVAPFTWVHGGGASDGNFLTAGGLPNLDGIGPIGDNLHSNRRVSPRRDHRAARADRGALCTALRPARVALPPAKG